MRFKVVILLAVMALVVASCGGGGNGLPATKTPAAEVESTGGTGDTVAADKNESENP